MKQQVDKSHYAFGSYMHKPRWISVWHQLDEVLRLEPKNVLEIGPGLGTFKSVAKVFGVDVSTLDIAADLAPDIVGSATSIPLLDKSLDVACAFQVLEHMPFDVSMSVLKEMGRVARKGVVISLPDSKAVWPSTIKLPLLRERKIMIPNPFFRSKTHLFDGEHYWELNKDCYPLGRIAEEMQTVLSASSLRSFRVHENPYHRFFSFRLR